MAFGPIEFRKRPIFSSVHTDATLNQRPHDRVLTLFSPAELHFNLICKPPLDGIEAIL
jgi:hypothetical protein